MVRLRESISVFCCSVLYEILLHPSLSLVSLEHEGFFLITIKSLNSHTHTHTHKSNLWVIQINSETNVWEDLISLNVA